METAKFVVGIGVSFLGLLGIIHTMAETKGTRAEDYPVNREIEFLQATVFFVGGLIVLFC